MGYHFVPVVDFHGEMHRCSQHRVFGVGGMNFPIADAELQLPLIGFRTPVVEFGSQHLFIPLPGSVAVSDLDINMLNYRDSGHTRPS